MKQQAWLNTYQKNAPMARIDMLSKKDVVLPDVKPFGYLLELLSQAGGYASVLSWRELQAWKSEMKLEVCAWEMELLHKLSRIFHNAVSSYNMEQVPSPLQEIEAANAPKQDITKKLKAALRSVAPNKREAARRKRTR